MVKKKGNFHHRGHREHREEKRQIKFFKKF